MGQVTLSINGRNYDVACDDGQEDQLHRLGGYIDERVRELASGVGHVGDAQLLLMVGLLIADELSEAYDRVDELQQNARWGGESEAARGLENMAERIESIAARLGRA